MKTTYIPKYTHVDFRKLRTEITFRYNARLVANRNGEYVNTVKNDSGKLDPKVEGLFEGVTLYSTYDKNLGEFDIRVIATADKRSLTRIYVVGTNGKLVPAGRLSQAHK